MIGKFDKQGHLLILKKNHYKIQKCPYSSHLSYCGDWCPLLNENRDKKLGHQVVSLCNNETLKITEDER